MNKVKFNWIKNINLDKVNYNYLDPVFIILFLSKSKYILNIIYLNKKISFDNIELVNYKFIKKKLIFKYFVY